MKPAWAPVPGPGLWPCGEVSLAHRFQGLALLNLAAGKSSLCRPGTQRQSATGNSHPRGVFSELWRHCSCAQGARAAGPGSVTQPRAAGHSLAWSCVRTTQCGCLKAKRQRKKNTGNSLCPSDGRAFLENQQGRLLPARRPRRGPPGAGGSHRRYFEIFSVWCDVG